MIRALYKQDILHDDVKETNEILINHNLNSKEVMVFDTYNFITSVKILDNNNLIVYIGDGGGEGGETVYVLRIGKSKEQKSIVESLSYMKVGKGESKHWNAFFEGDLSDPYDKKYDIEIYEYPNYYAVKGNILAIDNQMEMNITEIGLFNEEDKIMFYSKCSLLHKAVNSDLSVWYRIMK